MERVVKDVEMKIQLVSIEKYLKSENLKLLNYTRLEANFVKRKNYYLHFKTQLSLKNKITGRRNKRNLVWRCLKYCFRKRIRSDIIIIFELRIPLSFKTLVLTVFL